MRNATFRHIFGLVLWLGASGTGCQTGTPMNELSDLDDHESEPVAQVVEKDAPSPSEDSASPRFLGALMGAFFGTNVR